LYEERGETKRERVRINKLTPSGLIWSLEQKAWKKRKIGGGDSGGGEKVRGVLAKYFERGGERVKGGLKHINSKRKGVLHKENYGEKLANWGGKKQRGR